MPDSSPSAYDLLIIGAGINGAGIARDAAGRGLSVLIVDQGDIGGATSSASSKLIHGGLRYLEFYEFRLVAEALAEREVLLRIAPHLTRPLRFVMPHVPSLRPAWMIRLGLLLYDSLGRLRRRATLPGSRSLDLSGSILGEALQDRYRRAFSYYDVATDDARLTLANARAAADLGARLMTRTRFANARREQGFWHATLEGAAGEGCSEIRARALVNAAGPWAAGVMAGLPGQKGRAGVQLVKGSHVVVPRLYPGDHAYLLQNDDRRVVFLLPFEEIYTLIGTTEQRVDEPESAPVSADEINYLCRAASRYTRVPVTPGDVVWSYSGVRPLTDDGAGNPSAVSRDYSFVLDDADQAPALSVIGGKLTTYRKLAEAALAKLSPWFAQMGPAWTDTRPLPGGDFDTLPKLVAKLQRRHPDLPKQWLAQIAHRHGSLASAVIGEAKNVAELGRDFGGGLYERELRYFVEHEWARSVEDIVWRRSKAGLALSEAQLAELALWCAKLR
ncbi:MAG TPA: glycerol-3-phosphate dehydrogenase [Rhodocyclaceae bacterium]|nr:glycerol-3-phosphate dehydrogenase [Rhodocyclaceae bacterium]